MSKTLDEKLVEDLDNPNAVYLNFLTEKNNRIGYWLEKLNSEKANQDMKLCIDMFEDDTVNVEAIDRYITEIYGHLLT